MKYQDVDMKMRIIKGEYYPTQSLKEFMNTNKIKSMTLAGTSGDTFTIDFKRPALCVITDVEDNTDEIPRS